MLSSLGMKIKYNNISASKSFVLEDDKDEFELMSAERNFYFSNVVLKLNGQCDSIKRWGF